MRERGLLPSSHPGQPPPSFATSGEGFKVTAALCNWKHVHVLQSINLAVCSVGQAVQANWLNSYAGMSVSWNVVGLGSILGFDTNKLRDLGKSVPHTGPWFLLQLTVCGKPPPRSRWLICWPLGMIRLNFCCGRFHILVRDRQK